MCAAPGGKSVFAWKTLNPEFLFCNEVIGKRMGMLISNLRRNEQVSEWLLRKFSEFQPVTVPHLEKYRSHLTGIPCDRMWPQDKLGAGAFTVLFQNTSEGETNRLPADFLDLARFAL